MRTEKRKKNAPKELTRLKAALGQGEKGEITMKDVAEIATVVPAEKLKEKPKDVEMQEDGGKICCPYCGSFSTHALSLNVCHNMISVVFQQMLVRWI